MLNQINGLHHVTSIASDPQANNDFFTKVLGLRRVKKTVNFDRPDVYHLYYGDTTGTPGTVMTYFPFPNRERGRHGSGEAGMTVFSAPAGSFDFWRERLETHSVRDIQDMDRFGQAYLAFEGPDGEELALAEVIGDERAPWTGGNVSREMALHGFHSVSLRLADGKASEDLLRLMGYEKRDVAAGLTRMAVTDGNGADVIDIETVPTAKPARQGAGSVHHIAFAVDDRRRQLEVRSVLEDAGYEVTQVIDRDYFLAIYFRSPGGVLFEVATNEPGFDRDEDRMHLGEALKLPAQHEHLREKLERDLLPIED